MKKLFVCLAMVLPMAISAHAAENPIDKGSVILAGDIFFQSQSGDLYENYQGDALTTISVMPSVSFFVVPGLAIGGNAEVFSLSQGGRSQTLYLVGPTVGGYFNMTRTRTEVKGSIYTYIEALFMFGGMTNGSDIQILNYGGMGGVMVMLSNAVAADFNILFQGESWKPDDANESTTGTTLRFGVGISAFLWD